MRLESLNIALHHKSYAALKKELREAINDKHCTTWTSYATLREVVKNRVREVKREHCTAIVKTDVALPDPKAFPPRG